MKRLVLLMLLLVCNSGSAIAETAEQIMKMVEANVYYGEAYMESDMTIRSGRREMTKTMSIWVQGQNALAEFTNPADRGTKYLKLEDEMWIFFPDAEDLVLISGHMLRQGFMGSDMSYEDMMTTEKLSELYDLELESQEDLDGRPTWVIGATAKEGVDVSYAIRKMWIDQEYHISVREELYAVSGRLLKVSRVEEIDQIAGRNYPVTVVTEDALRRDSSTTLRILHIDFDIDVADGLFSLESLQR